MQASQTDAGAGRLEASVAGSVPRKAASELTPWCSSPGKRFFDLVAVSAILFAVWPVMLLVAAAIKASSRGPVLFRQKRVGRNGKLFELMKFRSMHLDAEKRGPGITRENDPRIFPLGRRLRKWKLDELPQLFNVIRGDMTLVGPRPDLPEFCATLSASQRSILQLKPGVTGAATLAYRQEEQILSAHTGENIADYYITHIYPDKARIDLEYAAKAGFMGDIRILSETLRAILS
ncbi:MAG TPA: sugar transferase [Candidatus Angelobacter sp.]|nr:sugar transferase [Candidatus Angelobacter sp.]